MSRKSIRQKSRSLSFQLLLRFFSLFIILLIIIGISQYVTMNRYLLNSKLQLIQSRLHYHDIGSIRHASTPEELKELASNLRKDTSEKGVLIAVIDESGNLLSEASDPDGRIIIPRFSPDFYKNILNNSKDVSIYKLKEQANGSPQIIEFFKLKGAAGNIGLLQLSVPANDMEETLNHQIMFFILPSLVFLLIGGFFLKAVIGYTIKPIKNIADTMDGITTEELSVKLSEESGQLEADMLAHSFNNMLQRIKLSFEMEQQVKEKMRHFISDASHELRTPLTSIHGFAEILLSGAAKNEEQLKLSLKSILTESERLTKLVNDLLTITRLEGGNSPNLKREDLSLLISETVPQLEIMLSKRKFKLDIENGIHVLCIRDQIKQVLINIINNSVQHTDEITGVISISLKRIAFDDTSLNLPPTGAENLTEYKSNTFIHLTIEDNGTGIPEKDIPHIFDRFYRSETHRSRKRGGYGLGLSIVKEIADRHSCEISVNSELGKGTSFTLIFKEAN